QLKHQAENSPHEKAAPKGGFVIFNSAFPELTSVLVNELFKLFTGLEISNPFCRYIDRLARLRVSALARVAFADTKASKASQFDLFAAVQRFDNAVKNHFY